jgi:hypothetical protein
VEEEKGLVMETKEPATLLDMVELPTEELTSILRQGATLRLPYLESRLLQAQEQVGHFEGKYNTTLEALGSQGLPDDAGYEMHEDFVEWEYWNDVLHKSELAVRNVKLLLEKVGEGVDLY